MKSPHRFALLLAAFLSFAAANGFAANYPEPKQGDWVAHDFRFHTGDVMEVKLRYRKGDANDVLFQWESSFDHDPSPDLERIRAAVLAINSSDDERNPPELGVMERELKRVKNARCYLVPGSPDTRGHGTTGLAKLYKKQLEELLREAPKR
jgi:pimeloyl-ACP methyl ester carboxylesterase